MERDFSFEKYILQNKISINRNEIFDLSSLVSPLTESEDIEACQHMEDCPFVEKNESDRVTEVFDVKFPAWAAIGGLIIGFFSEVFHF